MKVISNQRYNELMQIDKNFDNYNENLLKLTNINKEQEKKIEYLQKVIDNLKREIEEIKKNIDSNTIYEEYLYGKDDK